MSSFTDALATLPGSSEADGVVTCFTHKIAETAGALGGMSDITGDSMGVYFDAVVDETNHRLTRISDAQHTVEELEEV